MVRYVQKSFREEKQRLRNKEILDLILRWADFLL
jgi:hypothetical protein